MHCAVLRLVFRGIVLVEMAYVRCCVLRQTVMTVVCVCAGFMCLASVQPTCMQQTSMRGMHPADMRASIKCALCVHAA